MSLSNLTNSPSLARTMRRVVAQGRRYRSYRPSMVLHKIVRRYEASRVESCRAEGSGKEIESFFLLVPVLVSGTEDRSFDFGETAMRDETRSGENRGGEEGRIRIPRDRIRSFRGKMWKGKGKLEGRCLDSNENIVSISRSRRIDDYSKRMQRIETNRGNIRSMKRMKRSRRFSKQSV